MTQAQTSILSSIAAGLSALAVTVQVVGFFKPNLTHRGLVTQEYVEIELNKKLDKTDQDVITMTNLQEEMIKRKQAFTDAT
ncbi:MAG: hypothetical protein LBR79_02635 [Oscillospiraceae bacterium]|jgi:hypothetical protein|nr:hypothetical protein [Oscillospiraceae bacterium]